MTADVPNRGSWRQRSGQGLVESVLVVALASLGLALVLLVFRNQIGNGIDNLSTTVQSAPQSPYVPGGGPTAGRGRGGGVGGGQGSGRGAGS